MAEGPPSVAASVEAVTRAVAPPAARPVTLVLLIALVGIMAASVLIGSVRIPARIIALAIFDPVGLATADETARTIVLQIRLPRTVLAAAVGMALASSGTVFQGLFRNPMADPYIIGVSGGAALGATIAIVFGLTLSAFGLSAVTILAFTGALLVTAIVYRLAWHRGDVIPEQLLLAGVAIGAFLAAVISALQLAGGASLQQVLFWLMGGFSGRSWDHLVLAAPYLVAGYAVARLFARDLNLLVLGDETAKSLGVTVARSRGALTVAASLLAAAAVAVSGLIGFVGLIVPHLMRIVVGPDHRRLLPAAALAGSITLVVADMLARTLIAPAEIPVGIVTAGLGAPFFLHILRKSRKKVFWS